MAYYSGQASSYQELLNVLVTACVEQGWAWADGILSKGDCFIQLTVSTVAGNIGITARGGTGKSGTTLLNPALTRPRMGDFGTSITVIFPVLYQVFVFDNEVYIKIKFSVDCYYYLAFGKSSLPLAQNGLWISASACGAGRHSSYGIAITPSEGGAGGSNNRSAVAPFWNPNSFTDDWSNAVIAHGLDNVIWSSGNKIANFVSSLGALNNRMPSVWLSESPLLPFNIYVDRPSSKKSLVCQFQHVRYLRIDNYEPEQIITLGSDKWMVFPFFRKNSSARDGGDHTGTFGWAIRYDGP